MGVIRGVTEEDILAFLREHGIEAGVNYLVVRKYRGLLGGDRQAPGVEPVECD
ncbi:hypothetical protein [Actinotignum sp. GS-2025c]|uniref:hypothetical protein n=1 Tax=Actinotignum sp. GS-2025c TaxID=3427276 RepID=UPI003F48EB11